MESVYDILESFDGQPQCESAMPGGACVCEELELHAVRRKLSAFQEDFNAEGIESW